MGRHFFGIAVLFLLMGVCISVSDICLVRAESTIIVVPDDFPTIQEAINNANQGDTIQISSGTYYEKIVVNKTVSLIGDDKYLTHVEGDGTGSVLVVTQNNVSVTGFTIRGSGSTPNVDAGIYLENVSYCTISGNRLLDNEYGISLRDSYQNIISENLAMESDFFGIHLEYSSDNNTLVKNFLSGNRGGINIHFSSHFNTVSRNRIANGTYGVSLNNADSNQINQNFMSHLELGICLQINTDFNLVIENNITDCSEGVELRQANNNRFYHNTFNNLQQVVISNFGYLNFWDNDYPSGGNYWSDYDGTDLDNDGIGDTSYHITVNNTDNYPIAGKHSDLNATSEHSIQIICNSTISNFNYNGSTITFEVTGEEGTAGFCRITIPTALMNETYRIFVNSREISHTKLPVSNSTHSYLYCTFEHSNKEITIISEFSTIVYSSIMITTLLALVVVPLEKAVKLCKEYRDKHKVRLFSQCWGCLKYSKEEPTKMCFYNENNPTENRGCKFATNYSTRARASQRFVES